MTMSNLDFFCVSGTPRFRDRPAQSLRSLADRLDMSEENVHMGHMLLDDHTESTPESSLPTNIMHTDWLVFRCPWWSYSLEIAPFWLRLTTSQNSSNSIQCYLTSSWCLPMTPSIHRYLCLRWSWNPESKTLVTTCVLFLSKFLHGSARQNDVLLVAVDMINLFPQNGTSDPQISVVDEVSTWSDDKKISFSVTSHQNETDLSAEADLPNNAW